MITIYKTESCPKCHVLKTKLDEKGIEYKECVDLDEMRELGIMSVPQLKNDGELMDFMTALAWVNSL